MKTKQGKICCDCRKMKDLNNFGFSKASFDGHNYYCKVCKSRQSAISYYKNRKKLLKKYRERYSDPIKKQLIIQRVGMYRYKFPIKWAARAAIRRLILQGKIKRQPCEICGRKSQTHHPDYSKPLEVKWLCLNHHKEVHRKYKFA